jgi:hypothetical protein
MSMAAPRVGSRPKRAISRPNVVARWAMDLLLLVAGGHTRHLASTRRWRRHSGAADPRGGRRIRVRVGGRPPTVPTGGRRFTVDDNGTAERSSAATDRAREEQRVRCGPSRRVLRPLRSEPRPTGVSSRSEDRSECAPRHIGRIMAAPPGPQCVARRQYNRVPRQVLSRADLMLIENFR